MQWTLGALSPDIKWPGHKSECAPPSGAEIMNERSYISVISILIILKLQAGNGSVTVPVKCQTCPGEELGLKCD
jgi:hypothetical protein